MIDLLITHILMRGIYFCLLAGCTFFKISLFAQSPDRYPPGIGHVIVVGVDGMSPDGIRNAPTPVMHQLIAGGAVKWNVRTILPSISAPNWASMISGGGSELHGVTDNDWGRQEYTLPPLVMDEEGIAPTIFQWIRRNKPAAEIGTAYQWEGFGNLFEKKAVNFDKHFPDEQSTANGFAEYIKTKKPLFAFMHLDHVDDAGHEYGHGTAEYYRAVSKADSLIGEVLSAIKEAGIEKSTLLIVTADHGGIGYGHGGATIEEAEIAMILYGKEIKKGYKIKQQVYTYDLAATVAFALHIVPPYAWTGRPIKSAFTGFEEPANLYLGRSIIPSPKVFPAKYLYQKAGGLFIDKPAEVSMQTVAENSIIRYTTDGSIPVKTSLKYTNPFKLDTTAVVTAKSFDTAGNESLPATAYYRVVHSGQGHGVTLKFYAGPEWENLPVFSSLEITRQWNTYEFHLDREEILPLLKKDSSSFGAVFEGFIEIGEPGQYTFYTQSDDGSKLYIDGKTIVNNDGDHGVVEKSGTAMLDKGRHAIRVEYYNASGGFWLDAMYKGPGVPKQIIPANKLYLKKEG